MIIKKFYGKKEQQINSVKPFSELPPELKGCKREVKVVEVNTDEKNINKMKRS